MTKIFINTLIISLFCCYLIYGQKNNLPDRWWEKLNGNIRISPKLSKINLKGARAKLDSLHQSGYRIIEIFAPHQGTELYSGLAVLDFYKIDPALGTAEELKLFINDCHARGMAVTTFINPGYCADSAPFFIKACEDVKNNVTSKERNWFLWSDSDTLKLKNPNPFFKQEGYWVKSEKAGKFYWSKWKKQPQFNFGNTEWQEECKNIMKFYLEFGFDGIIVDATNFYVNCTWPIIRNCITDVINSFPNKFSQPEGGGGFGDDPVKWITEGKFTNIQDYNINNWWDKKSIIAGSIEINACCPIEPRLAEYHDRVVKAGGTCYTYPHWEKPLWSIKRLLEIATIIGTGQMFTFAGGSAITNWEEVKQWKPEEKQQMADLLNLANTQPAFFPNSKRQNIKTNDDTRYYAFIKSSADEKQKILVVLNFQGHSPEITIDLTKSGIKKGQTLVNLLDKTKNLKVESKFLKVKTPNWGYGYLFYEVK